MNTEQILLLALTTAGTLIVILIGLIVKSVFRMTDRITEQLKTLNTTLNTFVRREDCQSDMHSHCKRIESIDKRLGSLETEFTKLKVKAEIWHTEN